MYNANGVVAAHRDELFSCVAGKYIARRKRRVSDAMAKASTRKLRRRQQVRKGRLAELRPDVRRSVFEVSRTTGRVTYVTHARADAAAADADSIRRDKVKKQALLDKQVQAFCKAMEKIDVAPIVGDDVIMGRTTLASHKRQLAAHLGQIDSVPKRTRVLKENLERLVDGMGHSELKVGWAYSSKDRTPEQNVTFLTQKLEESWELIKEKKLPLSSDPICPALYTRKLPTHGEPTLQRAAFDTEQPRTAAELRAEAEAMVAERAQGARSSSGRRSRLCRDPPEITAALIGERVGVLYRLSYDVIEPGGRKAEQTGRFWCPGEITAISSSSWRSSDGKCKGEGFIFVRFDDGEEDYNHASRPSFFGANKLGSWRLEETDAAEDDDDDDGGDDDTVMADGAAAAAAGAAADDDDSDDEFEEEEEEEDDGGAARAEEQRAAREGRLAARAATRTPSP